MSLKINTHLVEFLESPKYMPWLLVIMGKPGSGKTSIAKSIQSLIKCKSIIIDDVLPSDNVFLNLRNFENHIIITDDILQRDLEKFRSYVILKTSPDMYSRKKSSTDPTQRMTESFSSLESYGYNSNWNNPIYITDKERQTWVLYDFAKADIFVGDEKF